jgi:hypothetical protein
MQNKKKNIALQDTDFTMGPRVHIADVGGSSPSSPTKPFQEVSRSSEVQFAADCGATVPRDFWSRIDVGRPDECWPWRGSVDRYGYGRVKFLYKTMSASRAAYIIATGTNIGDMLVCHHCDNPKCCNPSHLYAGTKSDNERDKYRRGRATQAGANNSASKLTKEAVENIRRLFKQGMSNVAIGQMLGVHHSTISKIRTGQSWASPQESADG